MAPLSRTFVLYQHVANQWIITVQTREPFHAFIEVKLIGLIGGELRQIHRGRAEMEKGLEKNLTQSLLKPIRDTRPEIDSQDKIDLITSEPG